jgi:hypothetical protein
MSTAAPARTWAVTIGRYLPGLVLLLVVGVVGTFAQTGLRSVATATGARLPDVEYVLWAIVIGLVIRNTVGVAAVFRPGVATYEFWLKIGIVLLGARFLLGELAKLGGFSLGLILIDMAVATTVILLVGRAFGLGGNSRRCSPWARRSAVSRRSSPGRAPSTPTTRTPATRLRRSSRSAPWLCSASRPSGMPWR